MSKSPRMRNRRLLFAAGVVLSVLALAGSAVAGTYIVTLASGATFESRYKPQVAPWDGGKVLVLSDVGNWLTLKRADIASVKSTSENRGLGFVIDNTTIALGWAPNDNLTPEQEAEAAQAAARSGQGLFQQQQPNYSVNQFVEPGATQGLPSNLIGGGGGYSSTMVVPLASVPAVDQAPVANAPVGQ